MVAFLGMMGGKKTGKSAVAHALRQAAGSDLQPVCDIEYSDIMIEVGNAALERVGADFERLEYELLRATEELLGPALGPFDEATAEKLLAEVVRRDIVRRDLMDHFRHVPPERLHRDNRDLHRAVLSWVGVIGTELIDPRLFQREVERRVAAAHRQMFGTPTLVTVGGIRRPGEDAPVRQRSGYLIEVRSLRAEADNDPANNLRGQLRPDIIIHNDVDGLDRLSEFVEPIWDDIRRRRPEPEYHPS